MDNISFVLWVCLWPVSCAIESYLSAKRRFLTGEEMISKDSRIITALIQLIIWIAVAKSI